MIMKKQWVVLILMLITTAIAISQAARAEDALPEVPAYSFAQEQHAIENTEEAEIRAKEFCGADCFQMEELSGAAWIAAPGENGFYTVTAEQENGIVSFVISEDGSLYRFENKLCRWTEAEVVDWQTFDDQNVNYEEWREKICVQIIEPFVRSFSPAATAECLETVKIDYESGIFFAGYDSAWRLGDEEFLYFYTDAYRDGSIRMKFVVQTRPVMRIVCFDAAVIAAEEGGNG